MDFLNTDQFADVRDQAVNWVRANVDPAWADEQHRTGDFHTPELHRRLASDGWLGAGWPAEYGGTDRPADLAAAIHQEIAALGIHEDGWATTDMICRTLLHVGSEDQKREFISGAVRGETLIVLGYTEPDSGSDVAAAKCRARRDGDDWIIDGQKMFTSTAQLATHVFLLTRSNFEAPKHAGLTTFLVPLDAPGVEIQPMLTVGGQRTNATFYSGVRVLDSARVGEAERGWDVMGVALVYERGGGGGGRSGPSLTERVAAWCRSTARPDGSTVFDDPTVQERLARISIESEVSSLLGQRVAWVSARGGMPGVEGSMSKLYSSEAAQRHYSTLQDILGPEAVLSERAPGAPLHGEVDVAFRYAIVGTIYGGTSEIQREIIAQRRLGLPRNRPRS